MNSPYSILIVLVFTMALFIWGYWRYDIVAIIALAVSVLIGAVPFHSVYTGLSNPAVITVACVMIISKVITRSGSINIIVNRITAYTKTQELHIGMLCLVTAFLSAFMNNVGALTLMMPIAIQTSIQNKRSPSLVLMPIAFASALGGLLTLIGTPPNILISAYRQRVIGEPFTMFSFARVDIYITITGILFLMFIGWRLLPHERKSPKQPEDIFEVHDYITEMKIPPESPTVGKTVAEFESNIQNDFSLIGLISNKKKRLSIPGDTVLNANDILIIEGAHEDLQTIVQSAKLELVGDSRVSSETLRSEEIALIEAVVPPNAHVENRSSQLIRLRARYHINLLAISRQGKPFNKRLNHVKLKAGDVVLLQGPADSLHENIGSLGFLPLVERGIQVTTPGKRMWLPLIIFCLAIACTAFQLMPVQIAFGGAVLAMALFRCMPTRFIYDGIDWSIIILLAAMIPVGEALQTTGGTALISQVLLIVTKHFAPEITLTLLFIFTMTLSDFMNNAATTVVMAPIAVSIAQSLHSNLDPFLMAVAIGASCSFLTPVGHQNNTLVMGPGGYKFFDYIRVGLPLEIIVLIVGLPILFYVWPL